MPSQTQFAVPLTGTPRPPLPLEHLNPHIKTRQYSLNISLTRLAHCLPNLAVDTSNLPTVKFQEIIREGQSTIVRRPTSYSQIFFELFYVTVIGSTHESPDSASNQSPICLPFASFPFRSLQVTRLSSAVLIQARSASQPCSVLRSQQLAMNRRGQRLTG
jgi:hypothetical protein